MKLFLLNITLCLSFFFFAETGHANEEQIVPLRGINLAGGEFGGKVLPGVHGKNYIFPTRDDIKTYANFGFQIIRLPFKWERLQPELNKPLDEEYLKYIDIVIDEAQKQNVKVILDVHNYGKYRKKLIGSEDVPTASFASFWSGLAAYYKDKPNVLFGLMNEPHKHNAKKWTNIAQEAITAIRTAGAAQTILVPGTYYSAAYKWLKKDGELSNAEALRHIHDPLDNFIFEAHFYFDRDSSGTHADCVSDTIGVERLTSFTNWLRINKHKGLLGEFGVSRDPVCIEALDKTLAYMDKNSDVWFGWTYWAASAWFGDYMFNIYPPNASIFPQARALKKYIDKKDQGEEK